MVNTNARKPAKAGTGIDDLLEKVLLESELLELKADPKLLPRGRLLKHH